MPHASVAQTPPAPEGQMDRHLGQPKKYGGGTFSSPHPLWRSTPVFQSTRRLSGDAADFSGGWASWFPGCRAEAGRELSPPWGGGQGTCPLARAGEGQGEPGPPPLPGLIFLLQETQAAGEKGPVYKFIPFLPIFTRVERMDDNIRQTLAGYANFGGPGAHTGEDTHGAHGADNSMPFSHHHADAGGQSGPCLVDIRRRPGYAYSRAHPRRPSQSLRRRPAPRRGRRTPP